MRISQRLMTLLWILVGFLAWIFAFRGYLTTKFALTSDALSYYDHTKFFIENLAHGVYPLWDPFWYHGVSNDFFLRRIGALNPFYLIILSLKLMGVPFSLAYLWSLGGYYWSGMIAFYLLAMRIYNNRFIAYGGYLILMFSALGTRIFDSYMMLVTVPLIWFFYFLTAFSQTPKKHFFLGMMLSFMILASTYIPFYFLIILSLFLMLFFTIYFDQVPEIIRRYLKFIKENKMLVLASSIVLVLSFLPIVIFFHDSAHGQMVLPVRHGNAGVGHTLTVPHQTLDWGAVEDLFYSFYFSDLRLFKFAVVYVPFFSIVVLILGLIGRISRRTVFIFMLGIILFCSIVPHGLPFYDFFYKHIFFLKYFRNLHFFIWFFLLPLFVMLVLEHWNMFTQMLNSHFRYKWFLLAYVLIVHLIVLLFILYRQDAVFSTYAMIALSAVFWSLMVLQYIQVNIWGYALLTLTVLIQPLEAYHFLSFKADLHSTPYDYDFSYSTFKFTEAQSINPAEVPTSKESLYYVSGGYNFIYQNVSNNALLKYLQNKFILVDRVEPVNHQQINTAVLEHNFSTDHNTAFVFDSRGQKLKLSGNDPYPPQTSQRVNSSSADFKLLSFDANHLQLSLNLPYEKFLIYNDSYDPYWKASLNQHPIALYEVNGAFKGVWIPSGHNVIEFSYGSWRQYAMNILLSICTFILFIGIIYYARLP